MPTERTYEGIYPQHWTKIKHAVGRYGFEIETDQGKAEAFGVTITWERRYQVASTAEPSLRIAILNAGILDPDKALRILDQIIQDAIS